MLTCVASVAAAHGGLAIAGLHGAGREGRPCGCPDCPSASGDNAKHDRDSGALATAEPPHAEMAPSPSQHLERLELFPR